MCSSSLLCSMFVVFARRLQRLPSEWKRQTYNVQQWNKSDERRSDLAPFAVHTKTPEPALLLGHSHHPQLCTFLSCLQPEHHTRDRSCPPPLCDTDAAAPPQGPVRWAWAPQTHPRVLFDVVVRTRADLGETGLVMLMGLTNRLTDASHDLLPILKRREKRAGLLSVRWLVHRRRHPWRTTWDSRDSPANDTQRNPVWWDSAQL